MVILLRVKTVVFPALERKCCSSRSVLHILAEILIVYGVGNDCRECILPERGHSETHQGGGGHECCVLWGDRRAW